MALGSQATSHCACALELSPLGIWLSVAHLGLWCKTGRSPTGAGSPVPDSPSLPIPAINSHLREHAFAPSERNSAQGPGRCKRLILALDCPTIQDFHSWDQTGNLHLPCNTHQAVVHTLSSVKVLSLLNPTVRASHCELEKLRLIVLGDLGWGWRDPMDVSPVCRDLTVKSGQ